MSEVVKYRDMIENTIMELGRHRDPWVRERAGKLWELFENYKYNVERAMYAKYMPSPN